jgi:two-component system KDP operon response regulator KdpE
MLTHSLLLERVWGEGYRDETHYLHVYVNRLRRKIEQDPERPRHLHAERGVGYRFVPVNDASMSEDVAQ